MEARPSNLIAVDTISFDETCGVCSAGVRRTQRLLQSRGFIYEPLQSPGVAEMFGFAPGEVPDEMKLRTTRGELLGGIDAILYICQRIWWAWPIWLISKVQARRRSFASPTHALPAIDTESARAAESDFLRPATDDCENPPPRIRSADMSDLPIQPIPGPFDATLSPPGSKSLTNRAGAGGNCEGDERINQRPLRR